MLVAAVAHRAGAVAVARRAVVAAAPIPGVAVVAAAPIPEVAGAADPMPAVAGVVAAEVAMVRAEGTDRRRRRRPD